MTPTLPPTCNRPLVIGFRGLIGAGKSTLANYLASLLTNSVILPFAGPLKRAVASCGFDKTTQPDLYRATAQALGAAARSVDPDAWVHRWHADLAHRLHYNAKLAFVLVDDVRYMNETKVCDLLFFIQRTDAPPLDARSDHESEVLALRGFDAQIDTALLFNDPTTPASFHGMVKVVLTHILEHPRCPLQPPHPLAQGPASG